MKTVVWAGRSARGLCKNCGRSVPRPPRSVWKPGTWKRRGHCLYCAADYYISLIDEFVATGWGGADDVYEDPAITAAKRAAEATELPKDPVQRRIELLSRRLRRLRFEKSDLYTPLLNVIRARSRYETEWDEWQAKVRRHLGTLKRLLWELTRAARP